MFIYQLAIIFFGGYILARKFGFPLLLSNEPFLIVYVSISLFVSVMYGNELWLIIKD